MGLTEIKAKLDEVSANVAESAAKLDAFIEFTNTTKTLVASLQTQLADAKAQIPNPEVLAALDQTAMDLATGVQSMEDKLDAQTPA